MSRFALKALICIWLLGQFVALAAPMDSPGHGARERSVLPSEGWEQQSNDVFSWIFPGQGSHLVSPHSSDNVDRYSSTPESAPAWQPGDAPSTGLYDTTAFEQGTTPWSLQHHHPTSSSYAAEHCSSTFHPLSPPIDDVDRNILNSILAHIEHEQRDGAQPSPGEHHDIIDLTQEDDDRPSSPPEKAPSGSGNGQHEDPQQFLHWINIQSDASTEDKRANDFELRRRRREPVSIGSLPHVVPLGDVYHDLRARIYINKDASVRSLINSMVFGGRLRWVELEEAPRIWDTLRRKSPTRMRHRLLPSVRISTPQGFSMGQIGVYITDHGNGKTSARTAGTVLDGKDYYAFWGMPQWGVKEAYPIQFFGIGMLSPELWRISGYERDVAAQAARFH